MRIYKKNNLQRLCGNLFLAILLLSTATITAHSQPYSKRIQIDGKKSTVEQIFNKIEEQSGYMLIYTDSFDVSRSVELPQSPTELTEILDRVLENSGYSYLFRGNNIILVKEDKLKEDELKPASQSQNKLQPIQSIYGTVEPVDKSSRISGAMVRLSGEVERQTTTDSIGYYSFEGIPKGRYRIEVSCEGYQKESVVKSVEQNDNLMVMVMLQPTFKEENRVWRASFIYPKYENQPRLPECKLYKHISPYQKQRLPLLAIKTNLLYDAFLMTNLGVEFRLGKALTIDLPVIYKPFEVRKSNYREFRILAVQPELRYWTQEVFNGHFFGAQLNYAQYKIARHSLPLGFYPKVKNSRYEGDFYGVGLTYGYHLMLSRSFAFEFTLGLGYGYIDYKRYCLDECSQFIERGHEHYLGPTKAGISLVFVIR